MISNSKRFLTRTLIRYPGVTYKKGINHEVNKKPLIFIFGWLGAAPKYINKYESMYNRKGYDVITYTSPALSILLFWRWKSMVRKMNQDFVNILNSNISSERPIVLHLFSNNGFYTYCYFQYLLRTTQDPNNILPRLKGTIIDSAPCRLNEKVFTKGFVDSIPPKVLSDKSRISKIVQTFFNILFKFKYFRDQLNFANFLLEEIPLPSPHLYFYSEIDELIRVKDIEEYIEHVTKNMEIKHVDSYKFKDSNHVQHFRKYPDVYEKYVMQFLKKIETTDQ